MSIEQLYYAKTVVNGREIDLVLNEQQVVDGLQSALINSGFVCASNGGNCWPVEKPEDCPFWRKVFNLCKNCDCPPKESVK